MSAIVNAEEDGPAFELRALQLARALHDPGGTQGSVMVSGQERDGLFVNSEEVHAYEFTISRAKDKAVKDAEKIADLLDILSRDKNHALKSFSGWFVTRDEPTADQRTAVAAISKRTGKKINAISVAQMYRRICDSEMYLQARDKSPFGSTSLTSFLASSGESIRVPVQFRSLGGVVSSVQDVASRVASGMRLLVIGDYGAGKSHALRDIYVFLRKEHFRRGKLTPFPLHINLRDCAGLRTPGEILRRHAEELGFDHANGLISAWRAGMCVLLLDGFDEVLPSRWFGSVADLKNVRWEALAPIRRLVDETPAGSGIVVAGRSHYFSSQAEMTSVLGFKPLEILSIPDFDENQLADYLQQSKSSWTLPDWVPARPLLLGYLLSLGNEVSTDITTSVSRAEGWRSFLSAVCAREAKMFNAVRPEVVEQIISRVATLARSGASSTGPISTEQLTEAWTSVNRFQPDSEGIQLLLRLPGLTSSIGPGGSDMRSFADADLAETAYGLDLAMFVANPYDDSHPLRSRVSWVNACSGLASEVAANALVEQACSVGTIGAAISKRQSDDAVVSDLIVACTFMPPSQKFAQSSYVVSGVAFDRLEVLDHPMFSQVTYQDCLIERLDLSVADESSFPRFLRCVISFVDGLSSIPKSLQSRFDACDIEAFSGTSETTDGILSLKLNRESAVALTILKKIFDQRGSGRKEAALSRGLGPTERELVPDVLLEMVSQGWVRRVGKGSNILYIGSRERRKDALRALATPSEFRLR